MDVNKKTRVSANSKSRRYPYSATKQRGRGSPADEGGGGFTGSDTIHDDTSTSWNESWIVTGASPIIHLKFSLDGSLFASASLVSNVHIYMYMYLYCVIVS